MDRVEFEAELRRDGYRIVNSSLKPNMLDPNHCHDFDAKIFVLGGEITITRDNKPETSRLPSFSFRPDRPVRLRGTENRHKAIQKSHAEVGFLSGLRPPSKTVSGSEKSYRPRKLRWRQISGERWAMSSLWTSMPSCLTWRMASCM